MVAMVAFAVFLKASLRRYVEQRLVFRWLILLEVVSTTTMLLTFYLINRLYGDRVANHLAHLNTSYFGYVVVGLAISELSNSTIGGVLGQLHEDKQNAVLERILAAPVSIQAWAIAAGVCNLARSIFKCTFIFLVAVLILRLKLPAFNPLAALAVVLTAVVPLWAVGLFSLSSILIFRRFDPLGWIFSIGFEVLGGVYVPQSVLPHGLARVAEFFPITPVVRAMEHVMYAGYGLSDVWPDLQRTLILTVFYLPAALLLLSVADVYSRRKGHYAILG